MSSEQQPPEPPKPSAKVAERLAVIVDAAERAALTVIDDAEREAGRYLEEAKARADRIVAERLRETAEELENHGERAAGPAAVESGRPRLRPVSLEQVEPPAEVAPDEDEARALRASDSPTAPRRTGSAAARLLATQMAVSGSSREEIELRLRNGFEIEDAGEILDAILGPEGADRDA